MVFSSNQNEKLLPILVSRAVIFFLLMSLLTLLLYIAGTVQEFTDSTQLFLLRLYAVLGFFLFTVSICGTVLDLQRLFRTKKVRYFFRAAGYMFLVVFGFVTILAVIFIIALSEGTGI